MIFLPFRGVFFVAGVAHLFYKVGGVLIHIAFGFCVAARRFGNGFVRIAGKREHFLDFVGFQSAFFREKFQPVAVERQVGSGEHDCAVRHVAFAAEKCGVLQQHEHGGGGGKPGD